MRSDAPAFALGQERGERGERLRLRLGLWPSTPSPSLDTQGWTGKPPWRCQEGRFWPLSTPSVPGHPPFTEEPGAYLSPGRTPLVPSPLNEEGWTGWTGTKEPGKQGENVSTPSMDTGMDGDGQPSAPPGLAPRALPSPPDNSSRARIGPSPRYRASAPGSPDPGSPLPTRSESLPTGLRPIGTPLPWSQGRIPATYLVPGLRRTLRYRTPACEDGGVVTPVGSGRGCPIKTRISGPGLPSARISPVQTRIAVC